MVSLYVAITDRSWFELLSQERPDEVNFWQPSGTRNFGAISVGELFLFKLHAPDDYIVGGGVFSHASNVPLSLAWEAFGIKNGVTSLPDMRRRIARYRRDDALLDQRTDPPVGCRILTQPFFWPREQWLPVPQSFARNIVTGKRYATEGAEGRYLWDAVADRAGLPVIDRQSAERFGTPQMVRPRLGQGAFRLAVTDAYERRCAVSGEKTLPILDAAHIRSYGEGGDHDPRQRPAAAHRYPSPIRAMSPSRTIIASRSATSSRLISTMAGIITTCTGPRCADRSAAMRRPLSTCSPGTASIATSDEPRRHYRR